MKQGHLFIMFLTIYTLCFMALYVEQSKYDDVLKEKQRVEKALLSASCAAADSYEKAIHESEEIRKNIVSEVFLESFYVSLGLFESLREQDILRMYLPLLVLAEEDGVFFYSMQEIKTEDAVELRHIWSEKVVFEETGAENISRVIEKTASEIVSKHNYIASQYGISYQFHVPEFLRSISDTPGGRTLFVVFQGWPLTISGDVLYENCIDAGIYITETNVEE